MFKALISHFSVIVCGFGRLPAEHLSPIFVELRRSMTDLLPVRPLLNYLILTTTVMRLTHSDLLCGILENLALLDDVHFFIEISDIALHVSHSLAHLIHFVVYLREHVELTCDVKLLIKCITLLMFIIVIFPVTENHEFFVVKGVNFRNLF